MKGKTYVLSDIHGNFEIFKRMLDKIQFNSHDQLIYLETFVIVDLVVWIFIFIFKNLIILPYSKETMNI